MIENMEKEDEDWIGGLFKRIEMDLRINNEKWNIQIPFRKLISRNGWKGEWG